MVTCSFSGSENPIELVKNCLSIFTQLDQDISKHKKITFDLQNCTWIYPCSAILISNKITELKNKGVQFSITYPKNDKVRAYFEHIGFPQGKSAQARTYSPIHHYSSNSEQEINNVLKKIENIFPHSAIDPIRYILSELGGNNIEEHSKYTLATVMAQYYEKKGYIDIGIFDNGISIPGQFEKHKIPFQEDGQAIFLALNGKSTKAQEGGRGFGLSTSRDLILKGLNGTLFVFSRQGIVEVDHRTPEQKIYKYEHLLLNGTLIYIRFHTPQKKIRMEQFYG